jgi:transcriptional regulator with XRE-family HTH domain
LSASITIAFGRVLRRLRLAAEFTQEGLGLEAELQRKYISSLELGEKQPSISTLFKLAAALKVRPGKLISLVEAELAEIDKTHTR